MGVLIVITLFPHTENLFDLYSAPHFSTTVLSTIHLIHCRWNKTLTRCTQVIKISYKASHIYRFIFVQSGTNKNETIVVHIPIQVIIITYHVFQFKIHTLSCDECNLIITSRKQNNLPTDICRLDCRTSICSYTIYEVKELF